MLYIPILSNHEWNWMRAVEGVKDFHKRMDQIPVGSPFFSIYLEQEATRSTYEAILVGEELCQREKFFRAHGIMVESE